MLGAEQVVAGRWIRGITEKTKRDDARRDTWLVMSSPFTSHLRPSDFSPTAARAAIVRGARGDWRSSTRGGEAAALPLGRALDEAPMTRLHMRFWLLAALGILLDGFDFFIIGVANPLVKRDFHATASQVGLVSAAAIVGAVFGASMLGPLGDKLGRARIFKYDLVMFVVFSLLCMGAWNMWTLTACRFMLGLAIGLDYPIAASYLAEVLPSKGRGKWLTGAFSLQAAGILLGAVVGVVILELFPHVYSWRFLLGFGAIPALIIIYLRRGVPESPRWLAQNGRESGGKGDRRQALAGAG